jgi:hypothetical protein
MVSKPRYSLFSPLKKPYLFLQIVIVSHFPKSYCIIVQTRLARRFIDSLLRPGFRRERQVSSHEGRIRTRRAGCVNGDNRFRGCRAGQDRIRKNTDIAYESDQLDTVKRMFPKIIKQSVRSERFLLEKQTPFGQIPDASVKLPALRADKTVRDRQLTPFPCPEIVLFVCIQSKDDRLPACL